MSVSAHVTDGCEVGGFELMLADMQFFAEGEMIASNVLNGAQGSTTEVVNLLCQDFQEGQHFCSIGEKRED